MISKGQSDFLNLVRWLAAGLVVVEHARSLLFKDFGSIESPNVFQMAFYVLTGFGHEAVVVFFVISGFLVGGKAWELWRINKFAWQKYLIDRVSRLYSVLIAALLIGGCLDWIGSTYFNSNGYYTNELSEQVSVISARFVDRLDAQHGVGSLLMLQDIAIPAYGSNGPLWSLAHEWWYYLLFPSVLMVIKSPPCRRLIAAILLAAMACLLTRSVLILFGVWLVGVVCWWLNGRARLPVWVGLLVFLAALLEMRMELIEGVTYVHHFILAIGFGMLLISFASDQREFVASRTSNLLSDFSYSVYLIHFPVLLILISAFFSFTLSTGRLDCTLPNLGWFSSFVFLAITTAYLVSLVTEKQTPFVRQFLYRLIRVS